MTTSTAMSLLTDSEKAAVLEVLVAGDGWSASATPRTTSDCCRGRPTSPGRRPPASLRTADLRVGLTGAELGGVSIVRG